MNFREYQVAAARTINPNLNKPGQELHALHGMVSEIGELHGIYQKFYQEHPMEEEHMKKELGDLMWFMAEYCECKGWSLEEIAMMNIEKLQKRYKVTFTAQESLNRQEGDV